MRSPKYVSAGQMFKKFSRSLKQIHPYAKIAWSVLSAGYKVFFFFVLGGGNELGHILHTSTARQKPDGTRQENWGSEAMNDACFFFWRRNFSSEGDDYFPEPRSGVARQTDHTMWLLYQIIP
jgi:hypothetical protein